MQLPNLFIAGAQKSGTTWLYMALKEHKNIYMSDVKELNFFNRPSNHDNPAALEEYLSNFKFRKKYKYIGEATPHYFWTHENRAVGNKSSASETTAEFIRRVSPEAKVILLLRNPVTRAVSAFHHHFAFGRVSVDCNIGEVDEKLGIIDMGHYERHVGYWRSVFEDNLLIYLYDDLREDSTAFLSSVFNDLQVVDYSDDVGLTLGRRKKIGKKREILSRETKKKIDTFPMVSRSQIEEMAEIFESDISFLETALQRDLASWRDVGEIENSLVYR